MSLPAKYRPARLADIRGHDKIVSQLASFAKAPAPKAFLFSGPPGTGKTSSAYALAADLGVDVAKKEWGGLHEIASGEMTAETVRELFKSTMGCIPWHGSGWKVIIANEADNMSDKAAFIWLDVLEHLPAKCVVVFTTNEADKLPRRFRERCESYVFKSPVKMFGGENTAAELAAQKLIDDVWQAELGHNHSPKLGDLDGIAESGHLSFRAVLQALEPLIRTQRQADEQSAMVPIIPLKRVEIQPMVAPARGSVSMDGLTEAGKAYLARMTGKGVAV